MNKILLFFFLVLWCGAARGQDNDRIISYSGDTIKCKIIKIENELIYFQKSGPDDPIKLKFVKNIIIDKQIKRKTNPDDLYDTFITLKKAMDSIPDLSEKKPEYFRHTIKINPVSFINEYTLKYEYRLKGKIGFQYELGYVHQLNRGLEKFGGYMIEPVSAYPFGYNGFVTRFGIRHYLSSILEEKTSCLTYSVFYKNQTHESNGYYDMQMKVWRAVYGVKVTISYQKYFRHVLLEIYGGISVRLISDKIEKYYYVDDYGQKLVYKTPITETNIYVLPAIQGGFNIGFGFNKKKKINNRVK